MSQPTNPFVLALHSFTAFTGALLGAAAAIAYVGGAALFEIGFGRPNPNQGPGLIIGLFILGVVLAAMGAFAGFLVQSVVRRRRHASPADRRYVAAALAVVVVTSVIFGILAVRRFEERSRPHVMQSTGAVTRLEDQTALTALAPAATVLEPCSRATAQSLTQENAKLEVTVAHGTITICRGDHQIDSVDVSGLDYVREVIATTAALDGTAEWLAVLVRLRATGRRELLLIYAPGGALVHKELLERTKSGPSPVLWTAGERGARQEFVLDLGQPLRFVVVK